LGAEVEGGGEFGGGCGVHGVGLVFAGGVLGPLGCVCLEVGVWVEDVGVVVEWVKFFDVGVH